MTDACREITHVLQSTCSFFFQSDSLRSSMGYCLSFAVPSKTGEYDDLSSQLFVNSPDERMRQQLMHSQNQLRDTQPAWDNAPLPRTLEEALRSRDRAVVITETEVPFRIVDVNTAWEGLCGYSFVECQGKTLGSLLRGPDTDKSAVTALVSQLLRGEEAGAVLTNYTKEGRMFRNRLRVGPLKDGDHTTHFVGILQEIKEDDRKVEPCG